MIEIGTPVELTPNIERTIRAGFVVALDASRAVKVRFEDGPEYWYNAANIRERRADRAAPRFGSTAA